MRKNALLGKQIVKKNYHFFSKKKEKKFQLITLRRIKW